jgi:hypothetical protein
LGASWGGDVVVVVVEEGGINPASTIDAVDAGFKLRSHAQRSCSILVHGSSIKIIKLRKFK